MYVQECVFGLVQSAWPQWLLQGNACMCLIVHSSSSSLLSLCTKSTEVRAQSTILDQLMFDCLAFFMQQLWQRENRLVSRHPIFFVFGVALGVDELCVST